MQIQRPTICCSDMNRLLTSEFRSSTQGERDAILKSLSYHTILTTSFNGRNSTLYPNGRNSTIVFHDPTLKSQPPGRTPTSQHHGQLQLSASWQTTQLSAYMAQNQFPTDSFSKSSNSQDHSFQA